MANSQSSCGCTSVAVVVVVVVGVARSVGLSVACFLPSLFISNAILRLRLHRLWGFVIGNPAHGPWDGGRKSKSFAGGESQHRPWLHARTHALPQIRLLTGAYLIWVGSRLFFPLVIHPSQSVNPSVCSPSSLSEALTRRSMHERWGGMAEREQWWRNGISVPPSGNKAGTTLPYTTVHHTTSRGRQAGRQAGGCCSTGGRCVGLQLCLAMETMRPPNVVIVK